MREQDGSPDVRPVLEIIVNNGTMTNDGAGQIQFGGSGGSGGEVNTASNTGNGIGWFKQKSTFDLEFKSAVSGDNVTMTQDATSVRISVTSIPSDDVIGIIGNNNGGTGLSSYTKGDLIVPSAANSLQKLAVGTNGQILSSDSSSLTGLRWVSPATTSAALLAQITDETGSGALVFGTSPSLTTPSLGVATATSINGLTISSSTGTLTISNGKVVTVSNTLTLAGTDSTTITFQGTDTYVGRTTTDTLTNKTLTAPKFIDQGFIADSNGNETLMLDQATSAVNFLVISNDITGRYPGLYASGDDANVGLVLGAKGKGNISVDHAFVGRVVTSADGANIAFDGSLGNTFTVTLGGARNMNPIVNLTDGQKVTIILSQDSAGSRTVTWSPFFVFGTDVTSPTLSTAAGKRDYIGGIYRVRGNPVDSRSLDIVAVSRGYA